VRTSRETVGTRNRAQHIRARIHQIAATVMHRCPSLSRYSLEQISDQLPFGVCQVGTVRRYVLASVRCRVAIPLGSLGSLRVRPIVASHTRNPQRRCSSSAISCKLAWARFVTMSCKIAICSGFNAGGLSPALTARYRRVDVSLPWHAPSTSR
jgi:hypothetical protein